MKNKSLLLSLLLVTILISCSNNQKETEMIEKKPFGKTSDGTETFLYTLKNKNGIIAEITNYGAAVVSLTVPDKYGNFKDIVLGYDNVSGYEKCQSYFGVIVGRYGNRIGDGKFTIDGNEYQVSINDGKNSLHGGFKGLNKRVWNAEPIFGDSSQSLKLTYISEDGEEGYPGKVEISVTYTLNDKNELALYYSGTTDKPTILNPTHHSYFNLTGDFTKTILEHQLMIEAETYTPVDNGLITTGAFEKVESTPMDFRVFTNIGAKINDKFEQLEFGKGYDHNWVINNWDGSVKKVAELYEPVTGRLMEVISDQPGIQFYSGNFLNGSAVGKGGVVYNHRTGLCLEAQHHPDSPNKPNFPSVQLNPGDQYKQVTIYKFSVK